MSFGFKQFYVVDDGCGQKVGTDGVLLGSWAFVGSSKSILDVGAGSGLVSLMLAQRCEADITAVEVDKAAAECCRRNFLASPWSNRLSVLHADFREVKGFFDLIVCNPPFFFGDLKSLSRERTLARQGETLNCLSIMDFASEHLTEGGRLAMITDTRHQNEIIFEAEIHRLFTARCCKVISKEGRQPIRLLWEMSKTKPISTETETLCLYRADGARHSDYVELTKDFYLK